MFSRLAPALPVHDFDFALIEKKVNVGVDVGEHVGVCVEAIDLLGDGLLGHCGCGPKR
jgi:hypothetical protein